MTPLFAVEERVGIWFVTLALSLADVANLLEEESDDEDDEGEVGRVDFGDENGDASDDDDDVELERMCE